MLMVPAIWVCGKTICSTVLVLKLGPMEASTADSTLRGRSMAREHTSGSMALSTRESGPSIKSAEKASTNGRMAEYTMDNGATTTCMDMEFTLGPMAVGTKANTKTIRNMAKEPTSGPTVDPTQAAGRTANNMETALIARYKALSVRATGLRANAVTGSTRSLKVERKERTKQFETMCRSIELLNKNLISAPIILNKQSFAVHGVLGFWGFGVLAS